MTGLDDLVRVVLIGCGATVVMDMWMVAMKRLGVPTLNIALVGRWVGHLRHGQFAHASIAQAPALKYELALGWVAHYVIGVAFSALLAGMQGTDWLYHPTVLPALATGVATVAVPLFLTQPAMGAGVAASKTSTPLMNCLRSLQAHTVFGLGLYLAAATFAGW